MADRVIAFVDAERELAADLSHRLRTPLTALRLDAERLPDDAVGDRIRGAVLALEDEIDAIIVGARRPARERAQESTDLVEVLADRLAFWAVLAEDHHRPWRVTGADRPVWVEVPRADLIGAVDALLGNVFEHTPQGTAFAIEVSEWALVVEDAGPGIADPAAALRRGVSGSGSTGLGLDIVGRVAASLGGSVRIDRGPLGGARVTLFIGSATRSAEPGTDPAVAASHRTGDHEIGGYEVGGYEVGGYGHSDQGAGDRAGRRTRR
jgi:signal transduction histidine kinase